MRFRFEWYMVDHVITKWLTCMAITRLESSKNATLLFHRFVTSEFFITEYNFLYHVVGYLSGFRFIYSFSVFPLTEGYGGWLSI